MGQFQCEISAHTLSNFIKYNLYCSFDNGEITDEGKYSSYRMCSSVHVIALPHNVPLPLGS